jgi:hypothetical protein
VHSIVVKPDTSRPIRIGTRKYTHRMTIRSGTPRTMYTSIVAGTRSARQGDSRASASITDTGKASTMPITERMSVAQMPPSGPLGYWPTSSSSQLSRRMSKMPNMAHLAAATR